MRFPRLHNRIRRLCAVTAVAVLLAVVPGSYEPVAAIAQTRSADTKNKKKGGSSKSKTQASSKSSAKKSAGRQSSTGQSRAKQSAAKQSSPKKNAVRNSSGKKSGAKGSAQSPKSSAEAKKMQEAAQKEIQKTKEQISLNEQEIKTGLADLNLLSSEISQCRAQVSGLEKKVASLEKSITDISSDIVKNEAELRVMREEYLKAVRKMRLTGKNQSVLAFLFSSDSFNQAMRRLRYMRRFSEWKERRSADIDTRIRRLAEEREHLDSVKVKQTAALGSLAKAQAGLEEKHGRQEKLVAGLRRNGDMLQSHLASKQAEANRLRSTIADLIAAEQAKAEADRKAREQQEAKRLAREKAEAERKAAAEREAAEKAAAAESAAAEKAEAERKAAEKIAAEKAAAAKAAAEKATLEKTVAAKAAAEKAEADRKAAEKAAKDKARVEKEARRLEEKKIKEEEKRIKNSEKGSRTKKDRKKTGQPSVHGEEPQAQTRPAYGENFAGLKGTLPRPVDGSWRITNPFGRHSMPELPEIVYDNPGIDAEVATGAAVKSVYGGKVSGVYKVAGYGTVVIVNHGEYYTVYGNLSSAGVSVGTNVSGGQTIGNAGTDPDDPRRGSVHFEVWKGREKQNPSQWIR